MFTGALLRFTVERFSDVAFDRRISYHSTVFSDMILGSRIQVGDLPRSYETLVHDREVRERYEVAVVSAADADRAEATVLKA